MKISRLLSLSVSLNVVLLGACGYLFSARSERASLPAKTIAPASTVAAVDDAAARFVPTSAPKFQWQQLEADDYLTYIANLRATGIPEETLRTIIGAEVATEYEQRRQEISAQPAPTELARYQKWQRLNQLPREQATVVASLLSAQPSQTRSAPAGHSTPNPSVSSEVLQSAPSELAGATTDSGTAEVRVPVLDPAVLVPADPATPLTEQQVVEWEKLQDDFVAAVGGSDQDPDDPAYGARWNEAQRVSDQMFRQKFGTVAFLRQNAEAGRRGKRE